MAFHFDCEKEHETDNAILVTDIARQKGVL